MNNELTVQELKTLPEKSYMLIDMRDEYAFNYGHIDRAVNIPQKVLNKNHTELPKDKKLIICCKSGIISCETAECCVKMDMTHTILQADTMIGCV